jgi:hypothetical protein
MAGILVLGGKKKSGKRLTGGGIMDMAANATGAALKMGSSLLQTGADMVKGSAGEAQAGGGRRRRRSSRRHGGSRHGGSRSRKLRKRTGKVRRHATRSYRKTKRTKRA